MSKIYKSQVFDSLGMFPSMWHECLAEAKRQGYYYIDFNGMVFRSIEQSPERKNAICYREDLIQG